MPIVEVPGQSLDSDRTLGPLYASTYVGSDKGSGGG